MSKRFINDDVEIQKHTRKAVSIPELELAKILWDYTEYSEDGEPFPGTIDAEDYASLITNEESPFRYDLGYANYIENFSVEMEDCGCKTSGIPLLGFCVLENGFTFYGVMGGSDWSYPIFSIFYYDGKNVQSYTPVRGNFVNLDWKCALGLEGEYCRMDEEEIIKKYKELGIYESPDLDGKSNITQAIFSSACTEWNEMYLKKYELDEAVLDWDAIKEEIMNVIVVG